MARYGSEKIRGHGIPEALEAILHRAQPHRAESRDPQAALLGDLDRHRRPFGAEGPIIMTGGAFGSLFAQLFHLSAAERKTLLVAGAAGGMAAIFATPVAAVLLAVELLLFEWKPRSFIPVAVAAIVAARAARAAARRWADFPGAAARGAGRRGARAAPCWSGSGAGLGPGVLDGAGLRVRGSAFAKLPIHWMWWPAIGGLVVGIGGLIDPRVLGVGYETIHGLLRGEMLGAALVGLLCAKALVWAVALGSGTSGGVLAPLLIIGGALGALVAALDSGRRSRVFGRWSAWRR